MGRGAQATIFSREGCTSCLPGRVRACAVCEPETPDPVVGCGQRPAFRTTWHAASCSVRGLRSQLSCGVTWKFGHIGLGPRPPAPHPVSLHSFILIHSGIGLQAVRGQWLGNQQPQEVQSLAQALLGRVTLGETLHLSELLCAPLWKVDHTHDPLRYVGTPSAMGDPLRCVESAQGYSCHT